MNTTPTLHTGHPHGANEHTEPDQQSMSAIVQDRYGTADVLELREIRKPTLGDHDVLVRVAAAGVDRGVWHR